MATLNLKSINQLIEDQAAVIQSKSTTLISFATGALMRAFVEANAMVGVWLQGLVLVVLNVTRLATSFDGDVDTFVNDFGLYRLAASASAGSITFSRFTPTNTALIPLGAQVQSADGTQTFQVVLDLTNPSWSATANGYLLPAGVSSLAVAVQAVNAGSGGNAAAGTISALLTSISGVDTVSNASAFVGGAAGESDPALKARFVQYILGLARGCHYGLASAIANMAIVIQYTLTEFTTYGGAYQPGFFYVVADDGTGSPSTVFLTNVTNAVQSVRPLGVQAAVFAPAVLTVNISLNITTAAGYTHAAVVAQVAALIQANIAAGGLGAGLDFYWISNWALSVLGVQNVTAVLLNGLSGDAATIAPNAQVTIKPGSISVS